MVSRFISATEATENASVGIWWYGNSVHLLDIGVTSESMNASIEPGRWYDIKIEIRGNSVKGYLDGKLVQEVSDTRANVSSLCASASRDDNPETSS